MLTNRRHWWKRYGAGTGLVLVLAAAISLATGWGSAVADQITKVFVTNDSAHPVPVQEQRTDANGNIKVHEQGTANANVTNDSAHPVPVHEQGTADVHVTNDLNVGSSTPITNGGGGLLVPSDGQVHGRPLAGGGFEEFTATTLTIHMTSDVHVVSFILTRSGVNVNLRSALFFGPAEGGTADVSLALSRPIKFDNIFCFGDGNGQCAVSWVGAFSP